MNRSAPGAYGKGIATLFNKPRVQHLRTSSLAGAQIAVTRLVAGPGGTGITAPIPREDAMIVSFQLKPLKRHELFKAGKQVFGKGYARHTINMVHLQEEPMAYLPTSYDCLQFYIPDIALRALTEDGSTPGLEGLRDVSGHQDDVVCAISNALVSALAMPDELGPLFFDHVGLALCSHLLNSYSETCRLPHHGGPLSPNQERLAKEILAAGMEDAPNLSDVASACGLPVTVFSRAFKRTTGMTPHGWLRSHRVEQAKALLSDTAMSLADIAHSCGFADQSHFTRSFHSAFGTTPGRWRRTRTVHVITAGSKGRVLARDA